MSKVSLSQSFPVPAQVLWNMIGGFNALPDWHPAVAKSEVEEKDGARVRTLTLHGGGTIVERLESASPNERFYSYSIQESPLPVANYVATLRVTEESPTSAKVEWASEFTPSGSSESEATAAIRGIYEAGFENLKRMLGQ